MSVCDVGDDGDVTPPFVFARSKAVTTDDFNVFKDEIRNMIRSLFSEQKQETKHFTTTLVEIKNLTSNVENAISLLSSQYQELNNKVLQLETKCKEGNEQIHLLEDRIETLQIAYRKPNFEIKNVPKKQSETKSDLVEMVLRLSSTIGCDLKREDVKDIYRVRGKKEQRNPSIVVETSSTMVKSDILRLSKVFNIKTKGKLCAKHLGFLTSEDTPIFICEQLTTKGARLYYLARDLAKSAQYKFCWTAYGKVYVRKTETSQVVCIKSEAQVHQLLIKE
ncbi:unnamed protein product [Euphydryas editha]|uniref:FP protein C-terminal domain-containing protein n=1 Tax=Euphydryas editha TaxID=104508 RepID=A0AAU9TFH7_EUPED|nr:unnamed protein product [Euphydryas editha]